MAKIEVKDNCPLNGFKPCKKFNCAWYIQLRGSHPQTGEALDEWGCAIAWMPILAIETAKEVRQGAAATEGMRNQLANAAEQAYLQRVEQARLEHK